MITLDEDDYHYVLNDGVDYNSTMIPHYFENEMNDLVSNYLTTPEYMTNYATPSTYSLTNLDATAPAANANGIIVLDTNVDESTAAAVDQQRTVEQFSMPFYERPMNADGSQHVIDHDFLSNKFNQSRPMDGQDYMIVSSEAIIDTADDILDLTNDEVDQIIDNHLAESQCFDGFAQTTHESMHQTNKARINVVGNLMRADFTTAADDLCHDEVNHMVEEPKIDLVCANSDACVQSTTSDAYGQTKKRSGRPKGARKMCKYKSNAICIHIALLKRSIVLHSLGGATSKMNALPYKCRVENCAMRFASANVLATHEQCHDTSNTNNEFRCPKCQIDTDETPKKWTYNTLATHLWRKHSIDLELYRCTYPDCNFKTPILSRLKNTHMKIHSDTKDFKCERCVKAFKNSRQLKNHRRIHSKIVPIRIRKCPHCNLSYSAHYIREHLLTHAATTATTEKMPKDSKEYKCDDCSYHSFDRNAFRRHRMVHSKQVKYKCPLCTFQAIQSANYKSHIIKKHPVNTRSFNAIESRSNTIFFFAFFFGLLQDSAKELIFMCEKCNFITVNKNLYYVHCLNHSTAFIC